MGRLVVLSAPSGTGKTTICKKLRDRFNDIVISVSYTTRPPRGKERNGVEYHFVDDATFDRMIKNNEFLEWANVFDRRYGSSRDDISVTNVENIHQTTPRSGPAHESFRLQLLDLPPS